jgi:hypothetical protein
MAKLSLAKVIGDLRSELELSIAQAAEKNLKFETGTIEVELTVEIEAAGEAGVHFWVVNIGGSGSRTSTHKITIPLTPVTLDGKPVLTGSTDVPT